MRNTTSFQLSIRQLFLILFYYRLKKSPLTWRPFSDYDIFSSIAKFTPSSQTSKGRKSREKTVKKKTKNIKCWEEN